MYTVTVVFHSSVFGTRTFSFNATADADAFDATVSKCRQYASSTKNY